MTHPLLPQELLDLVVDKVAENAAADGNQATLRACHQTSISLCLRSRAHLFKHISIPRPQKDPLISIQRFLDVAAPHTYRANEGNINASSRLPPGIAQHIRAAWIQFLFSEDTSTVEDSPNPPSTDNPQKRGTAETVVALLDVLHGADYGVRDLAFWNWPSSASSLRPDTRLKIHEAARRLLKSRFLCTLRLHAMASFPVGLLVGTSIRNIYVSMWAGGFLEEVEGFRVSGSSGAGFPSLELFEYREYQQGWNNSPLALKPVNGGLQRLLGALQVLRCGVSHDRDPVSTEPALVPAASIAQMCHRTLESLTLVIIRVHDPDGPISLGRWPAIQAFDNFFKTPFQNLQSIVLSVEQAINDEEYKAFDQLFPGNDPSFTVCCSIIRSLSKYLCRNPLVVTVKASFHKPCTPGTALDDPDGVETGRDSLDCVGDVVKQLDWSVLDTLSREEPSGLLFTLLLLLHSIPGPTTGRQPGYPITRRLMDLDEGVKEDVMVAAPSLKFVHPHHLRVEVSGTYYRTVPFQPF